MSQNREAIEGELQAYKVANPDWLGNLEKGKIVASYNHRLAALLVVQGGEQYATKKELDKVTKKLDKVTESQSESSYDIKGAAIAAGILAFIGSVLSATAPYGRSWRFWRQWQYGRVQQQDDVEENEG
eukprot:gene27413-33110_t